MRSFAQYGSQFAHFLHKPHERAVDAASDVLFKVHPANQILKLGQGDRCATRFARRRAGSAGVVRRHGKTDSFAGGKATGAIVDLS